MMSDLLASDNINLHNRVGKRDHAHTTLAPPHHESQRTRDQRKGPPLPKGNVTPRPTQSAKGGQRAGDQQAGPRTAHSHNRTNQQPAVHRARREGCTVHQVKAARNGGQSRLAAAGPGSTGRAHMHMLRSGVRDHRNATQGPARDGRRAGWQGKRRRQHARQLQPSHTRPNQRAPPTRAGPIHSNQHAKSVCWCPAHRPRAGRPNT